MQSFRKCVHRPARRLSLLTSVPPFLPAPLPSPAALAITPTSRPARSRAGARHQAGPQDDGGRALRRDQPHDHVPRREKAGGGEDRDGQGEQDERHREPARQQEEVHQEEEGAAAAGRASGRVLTRLGLVFSAIENLACCCVGYYLWRACCRAVVSVLHLGVRMALGSYVQRSGGDSCSLPESRRYPDTAFAVEA